MVMPDLEYQRKRVAKNLQKEIDKLQSGKIDLSKVDVKPSPMYKITQPISVSKRNKMLKADPNLREKEQAKKKGKKNDGGGSGGGGGGDKSQKKKKTPTASQIAAAEAAARRSKNKKKKK